MIKKNQFGPEEDQVLEWIRRVKPEDYEVRTRIFAAELVIMFHNQTFEGSPSFESIRQSRVDHKDEDYQRAWALLDCRPDSEDNARALDILKMNMGQILSDKEKILPAYSRILSRGDTMSEEEIIVTFTVAPQLGKWQDTVELGNRIIAKEGNLRRFRPSARHPTRPDYQIFWELAREEVKAGIFSLDPAELIWAKHKISGLRYRLRQTECTDESMVAHLRAKYSYPNWVEVSDISRRKLYRAGGVAHMAAITWASQNLYGPATTRTLKLKGMRKTESMIETEICRLQEVSPGDDMSDSDVERGGRSRRGRRRRVLWEGTFIWSREPTRSSASASRAGSPGPIHGTPAQQRDVRDVRDVAPTPAPMFAPSPPPAASAPSDSGGRYTPAQHRQEGAGIVRCYFEIQISIRT